MLEIQTDFEHVYDGFREFTHKCLKIEGCCMKNKNFPLSNYTAYMPIKSWRTLLELNVEKEKLSSTSVITTYASMISSPVLSSY